MPILVLVKRVEDAVDEFCGQRWRDHGGDNADIYPARGGVADQRPEPLLQLHNLLLRQVGHPGQGLVEGGRVEVRDEGEVGGGGHDPARQPQVLVVPLQPRRELLEGGAVTCSKHCSVVCTFFNFFIVTKYG